MHTTAGTPSLQGVDYSYGRNSQPDQLTSSTVAPQNAAGKSQLLSARTVQSASQHSYTTATRTDVAESTLHLVLCHCKVKHNSRTVEGLYRSSWVSDQTCSVNEANSVHRKYYDIRFLSTAQVSMMQGASLFQTLGC